MICVTHGVHNIGRMVCNVVELNSEGKENVRSWMVVFVVNAAMEGRQYDDDDWMVVHAACAKFWRVWNVIWMLLTCVRRSSNKSWVQTERIDWIELFTLFYLHICKKMHKIYKRFIKEYAQQNM